MYVWNAPTRVEVSSRTTLRFSVFGGAAILAAIALSTLTASLSVDIGAPPSALEVGEAWMADVNVKRAGLPVDDARPLVALTDGSGITHFFAAHPGARPGTYRVKIVLPEGGQWAYEVRVGRRVYERGVVRARQPSLPQGV